MTDELKPCPFCGAELKAWTAVQYPKMALARIHPGSVEDGTCPIAGWGFYDEQLETWNTRAEDTALQQRVRELEEAAIQLHSALAAHTCYGCPRCPGDCSSANPPVLDCPTQRAIEAYRTFDAALKGGTHD